jgi:hypothetical protein
MSADMLIEELCSNELDSVIQCVYPVSVVSTYRIKRRRVRGADDTAWQIASANVIGKVTLRTTWSSLCQPIFQVVRSAHVSYRKLCVATSAKLCWYARQ